MVLQQNDTYEEAKTNSQVTTIVTDSETVNKEKSSKDTQASDEKKSSSGKTVPDNEIITITKPRKIIEDINVITDYDWTYSLNKVKRETVPRVEIKEFKLAANTYISSLISSTLLLPDVLSSTVNGSAELASTLIELTKPEGDNQFSKFFNGLGSNTQSLVGGASELVNKGISKYTELVNNQFKKLDNTHSSWDDDIKNNYSYLYLRVSTGRSYIFPYFAQEHYSIGNAFDGSYDPFTAGEEALKNLSEIADKVSKFGAFTPTEPGMYIQRPKFYKFADDGNSISINFVLFNTITPNSYIKNLDLITKLIIQNTPHRFNRLLVDPPSVYEVKVPGKCFYPYAYISELSIDHVGTRRMIGKKIIPDAFSVKIQLKSLTSEVNNFLVPEMGNAGIDVTKRYRITEQNKTKFTPTEKKDQVIKATPKPENEQINIQDIKLDGRPYKTTQEWA